MRRIACVALSLFVAFIASTPAHAASDVDDIIEALKASPVYVEPGTENTTPDTAAQLASRITEDDSIVLVMLPSDESASPEEIQELAEDISEGLGDEYIVGVAVGDNYDAHGPMYPAGTPDELMQNADAVSQNSFDTLRTFVRNVHDWVRLNPDAFAPPPEAAEAADGNPWSWLQFLILGTLSTIGTFVFLRWNRRRIRHSVHYTAPGELNGRIKQLVSYRAKLPEDDRMSHAIDLVGRYTEAFFKRSPSEKRDESTIKLFSHQLGHAIELAKAYTYVKTNEFYVDDAREILQETAYEVEGLADTILKTVRRNNKQLLQDHRVSINVLGAYRELRSDR